MKINFKKLLPHILVLAILLIISMVYFHPALSGYSLKTNDIKQHKGMSKEIADFRQEHKEEPLWTNSMFGGMPATQISVVYNSNLMDYVYDVISLGLPRPVSTLWIYFLGFYILLMCLKIDPWIALIGAIAFGFSSYFIVILEAGHMSKANAIGFMAPTIGGIWLLLKGKYIKGVILTALFLSLELWCNHIQISYYMFFIIGALIYARFYKVFLIFRFRFLILALIKKADFKTIISDFKTDVKHALKFSTFIIPAVLLAVAVNLPLLWGTYEYGKYTTRGKSELTIPSPGTENKDRTDGLDRSYVTQWSYGRGETFTFFIPNAKGGGSGSLGEYFIDNEIEPNEQLLPALQYIGINSYWGDQPGTSGPVYIGAIVLLLAFLSLYYVRHWATYALLFVTIITVMLSWGSNMMWFTDYFLDNFPGYNKFRAVTMILVVAELCVPLMGVLFLKQLYEKREEIKNDIKGFYVIGGIFVGLSLLFIVTPKSFFTFFGTEEQKFQKLQIERNDNYPEEVREQLIGIYEMAIPAIEQTRISIFKKDATRSLILVVLAGVLILLFLNQKIIKEVFFAGFTILVLFDMVGISLRLLNNEKDGSDYVSWVENDLDLFPYTAYQGDYDILMLEAQKNPKIEDAIKAKLSEAKSASDDFLSFQQKQAIEFGVLNKMTNFRVFCVSNPFNEARTSYFHKSIGGYHGAKLKRYQELIEFHIGRNNSKVLEMLNTQYYMQLSVDEKGKETSMIQPIPTALGNAWIVSDINYVNNADEEITALGIEQGFDPANTAVVDVRYKDIAGQPVTRDPNASITLVDYAPNKLVYSFNSSQEQIAIFSEIFYELGWQAYIDNQPVEHFRANYVLRGLRIPAGNHEIVFKFELKSYQTGSFVSLISSLLVILAVLFLIYAAFKKPELVCDQANEEGSESANL
jgi:hypothetical protein